MAFRLICLFLFLGGMGLILLAMQVLDFFPGLREFVEFLLESTRLYDEEEEGFYE